MSEICMARAEKAAIQFHFLVSFSIEDSLQEANLAKKLFLWRS